MAEGTMSDSLVYSFRYYVFYWGGGNGDSLRGEEFCGWLYISFIIIIIIHEFHRDASLETKLQGRYVSRITLQL